MATACAAVRWGDSESTGRAVGFLRGVVFAAESLVGMMVTQYVLLLAAWVLIGGSVLRLVVLALLVTAAATVFASLPTESVRPRARK